MAKEDYEIEVIHRRKEAEYLMVMTPAELTDVWEDRSTQSRFEAEENCALLASGEVIELEDENPDYACTVLARRA